MQVTQLKLSKLTAMRKRQFLSVIGYGQQLVKNQVKPATGVFLIIAVLS